MHPDYKTNNLLLKEQIEKRRNQLNQLIEKHGCNALQHPDVLKVSRELDYLITIYSKKSLMAGT